MQIEINGYLHGFLVSYRGLSLPLLRFPFQGGSCSAKTISSSGRDTD